MCGSSQSAGSLESPLVPRARTALARGRRKAQFNRVCHLRRAQACGTPSVRLSKGWMRKALSALIVGTATLVMAPATSAAPLPNPVFIVPDAGSVCSGGPIGSTHLASVRDQAGGGSLVTTVDASAGRTLTVTNECTAGVVSAFIEDSVGGEISDNRIPAGQTRNIDLTGGAVVTFYAYSSPGGTPTYTTLASSVTITGSSGPISGSTPPPILQQFGKPSSLTCDEVTPADLNWGGSSSGGWGESWAQWMNDGNGGAVCTRTLVYSTSQSKWMIG